MKQPKVTEIFSDNGEHSHFELIDIETGQTIWSEDKEEVLKNKLEQSLKLLIKLSNKPYFIWVPEVKKIAKLIHEAANYQTEQLKK